jgi:hypothetical protein
MAIVKEITINLNDDDAKKGLNDINKLFKEVDQSEQKAVESTMSLRAELKKLQTDLQSGKLTGAAFDEGIKKAGLMKDQINDVNNRIKALATDGADVALRGIGDFATGAVGAFSAVQGGMALFGEESEDVQKAIMKLQAAMAILNGVTAINTVLQGDSAGMVAVKKGGLLQLTGVTSLYTTVLGTSTGALKLFRIALVSTGVGAIVVALGLLVANFESISKWVTDLVDKFGGWRKVLLMVSPPIYAIIKALEMMGVIDDEQTSKAKANAEARIKASQKQSKELDKQKQKTGEYYDFEIRKAQASGGNVEVVEAKKRQAFLETLKAQNELERSWIRTSRATSDDIKRWNERQKEITKIQQDIVISEIESQKRINEEAKKRNEEARKIAEDRRNKAREERKKQLEEEQKAKEEQARKEIDDEIKRQEAIQNIRNSYALKIEDLQDVTEMQKLERQKARELANLEALNATETQKLELLQYYEGLKTGILKAEEDKRAENNRLHIEMLMKAETDLQNAKRGALDTGLNILSQFAGKNKAIALSILAIQKGLAIADVVVGASKSIALAKANLAAVPAVIGVVPNPMYAVQAAATLKGIATTKISAGISIASILAAGISNASSIIGGGGGGAGGIGGSGGGGAGAPSATPIFNTIGASPVNQLTRALGEQPPVQAFVVGSQVTTQQSLDRNIIQNASLGG